MAKPADNLRDAVERTVEATLGSAERSRSAAQGALDDLVESVEDLRKGAEERLSRGRRSVTEAIEGRRPATSEDIKELKAELRAIGRRLDKIEERLPAKRTRAQVPSKQSSSKRSVVVAGRRVLITGVGSQVGSLLAARLERDPDVEYVAGLDTRRPQLPLERTEFIEADIRDPEIGRLIPPTGVDTIVHEQIVRQPGAGMSSRAMHDINVIGTLQLLGACERVPTLRTIVVRGSAGIYGAEPQAPQFFKEEMADHVPAAHALPARRGGDRELLRDLLAPARGRGLHDAALPARDRPRPPDADHALPLAAGLPDLHGLRPAHPARAHRRRARGARGGRAQPGAAAR